MGQAPLYSGGLPTAATSNEWQCYVPDEEAERVPAPARRAAEEVAGLPIYCRYAGIAANESSCLYVAVGPLGFCWVNGRMDGPAWAIEPTRVPIEPYSSRWLAVTNEGRPAPAAEEDEPAQPAARAVKSFDYLPRSFLDELGRLPPRIQRFVQEPFRNTTPDFHWGSWCARTRAESERATAFLFHQWIVVTAPSLLSVAYGLRETVLPSGTSWEKAFEGLMTEPWRTAHASWYAGAPTGPTKWDAYTLLGVTPAASDAEISRAYRRLARYFHPDSALYGSPSDTPLADFNALRAAYESIETARRRSTYDPTVTFRSSLIPSIGNVGWWMPPEQAGAALLRGS